MTQIELSDDDAALVLYGNGGVEIVIPKGADDDVAPMNVTLVSILGMRLYDQKWLEGQLAWLDKQINPPLHVRLLRRMKGEK